MKRIIIKTIAFILLISLVACMLCSCGSKMLKMMPNDELRSVMMISMANGNMEELEAYKVTTKMNMFIDGITIKTTSTATYMEKGTDDYRFYNKTETISNPNTSSSQKIVIDSGYQDGKMFRRTVKDGTMMQKMSSEISLDDYLEFEEEVLSANYLENLKFDIEDVGNSTCEEQEDGSWVTKLSDFSDEAVHMFYMFFNDEGSTNIDFENIAIEIIANEELLLTNINIDFVFEEESNNKISIDTTYSDFDSASFEPINIDDFEQVDDLTILDKISSKLEIEQSKDSGGFNFVQTEKASYMQSKETVSETYYVTYDTEEDKFSYEINTESEKTKITYKDETVKTYEDSKLKKTQKSNDLDEKATIASLMNCMGYDPSMIYSIIEEDLGDGEMRYILSVNGAYGAYYEAYVALIEQAKGEIFSSRMRFEFKLKDGELVSSISIMEIDATIGRGVGEFDLKFTCNYNP